MTQEERQKEKELLLNVLKDGLPYGLQLQITDIDKFTFNGELLVLSKNWCRLNIADPVKRAKVKNQTIPLNYIYIKPYLRPMSSMTSQEWCELCDCDTEDEKAAIYFKDGRRFVSHVNKETFLNSRHFDYRGLIEKGLAIAVTEENNPYKE